MPLRHRAKDNSGLIAVTAENNAFAASGCLDRDGTILDELGI